MHDDGYKFIGDSAINKLTLPEIRMLQEGRYQINQEKKRQRRAKRNANSEVSDTRMDIERSRDKNDKKMVENLAGKGE